jgi:hypothetical protein
MFNKLSQKIKSFLRRNHNFDVLKNRFILYFILFISVFNLICAGLMGDFIFVTLFILIGIITSFFSKNMVAVLTIALVGSNVINYTTSSHSFKYEGMDNENAKENETSKKNKNKEEIQDEVNITDDKYAEVKTKNLEGMQEKYKELMTLQDLILGKFGSLEESLVSAEKIITNIGTMN